MDGKLLIGISYPRISAASIPLGDNKSTQRQVDCERNLEFAIPTKWYIGC